MEFEIRFYRDSGNNSPIENFILDLGKSNKVLAAKTIQGIKKLRNRAYHREPLSKHLELQLWELRIKSGTDILRILYTFKTGRIIILLHVFIKKKQKTPKNEIEVARKRLKEIKIKEVN